MKTRITYFTTLVILAIFITAKPSSAEEKTKEYHEMWPASAVQSLEIVNKFGQVKVRNEGGSDITIDVVVTVEAANESRANELLNDINVTFRKTGNTVTAVTEISNNFKSQRKFSIDYEINVPSDKNLSISNKYGNTVVDKLFANGNFDVSYGNFSANALEAPQNGSMKLALAYGNGSIDRAGNLEVNVAYSPLSIDECKNLKLESKYSQISIDKAESLFAQSKYDNFSIDAIGSLTSESKYSHFRIDRLSKSIELETDYGSLKVAEVNPGFESVSVTSSYGPVSLGLKDSNYTLNASCSYCGVSFPEAQFNGNRSKESTSTEINGQVGTGTGGKVMIKSRYGDIRLND